MNDVPSARLAIAITTYNRAPMLAAILRDLVPTCDRLGVSVLISDNGSTDGTVALCEQWSKTSACFTFHQHRVPIPPERNFMFAIAMSDADYTWWACDDDYILPARVAEIVRILDAESPSAIVVRTVEVHDALALKLDEPIGAQIASVLAWHGSTGARRRFTSATDFYAEKFYGLPAPTVIYETKRTLSTDFERYYATYHPQLGALYEALAHEQDTRGAVDVLECLDVFSVSLTKHRPDGKDNWKEYFRPLAERAFPLFIEMLPPMYARHAQSAFAYHTHVFRAAFESDET